jgi:hypothetical protein
LAVSDACGGKDKLRKQSTPRDDPAIRPDIAGVIRHSRESVTFGCEVSMRGWLTPELILGLTLLSTFSLVGLISLWAAASQLSWYIRLIVVVILLGPMFLIPAYEPLLAFAVQTCVVVTGILLRTRRHRQIRFSTRTLFLGITPLAAVVCAIAAQVASLGYSNWKAANVIGLASGSAVLLGAWMGTTRRTLFILPLALALSAVVGLVVYSQDWVAYALLWGGGWPPAFPVWRMSSPSPARAQSLMAIWVGVMVGIALLNCTGTLLFGRCRKPTLNQFTDVSRNLAQVPRMSWGGARSLLFVFVLFVTAWPAYIYYRLLRPHPLTESPPPQYSVQAIVTAAKLFSESHLLSVESHEDVATPILKSEIKTFGSVYATLGDGLSSQSHIHETGPPSKSENPRAVQRETAGNLRILGNALFWAAELARREERIDDVVQNSLDILKLTERLRCGDDLGSAFAAMFLERLAVVSLYMVKDKLDVATCRQLLGELEELDRGRVSHEEMVRRDWVLAEHSGGWSGRLKKLVKYDFIPNAAQHFGNESATFHYAALTRLLICELAIRAYTIQHGEPPEQLSQLVPQFLKEIPADPHDPAGNSLRYRSSDSEYRIYSIGYDRQDGGGAAPKTGAGKASDDVELAPAY